MVGGRQLVDLLLEPARFWRERHDRPQTPITLFVETALPLMMIRTAAVLLRSLLFGSLRPGLVLAVGSLALQLGAWLGLALVLPAIARQFYAELKDRDAHALATYASVPIWLAGVFYLLPEEAWPVLLWSRLLVLVVGLYGLYILACGFAALGIERKVVPGLVTAVGLAAVILYVVLSLLLAVTAHVVIFVIGGS
ncbi:MAG: hypothetical protein HY903_22145 [Deltaproteobacteria bacterium]|nr:hypothetical protein [Deltaproteobacteria bacterium]